MIYVEVANPVKDKINKLELLFVFLFCISAIFFVEIITDEYLLSFYIWHFLKLFKSTKNNF